MKTTPTHCALCSEDFPPVPVTGAAGYAVTHEGLHICYRCADAREREQLRDRSKPFCAYLSSDGASITTWTGGNLMRVTQSWPCKLTRQSQFHDRNSYKCIRAVDVHGGRWYGRGSAGICITLRPCKG